MWKNTGKNKDFKIIAYLSKEVIQVSKLRPAIIFHISPLGISLACKILCMSLKDQPSGA